MFTDQKSNGINQPTPGADPILQRGNSGSAVVILQQLLNTHGFEVSADGMFGQATQIAVIQFQRQSGILADGIVGSQTWSMLRQANQAILLTIVCRYYDPFNYPHQTSALEWLQQQIPSSIMTEFALRWRNQVSGNVIVDWNS